MSTQAFDHAPRVDLESGDIVVLLTDGVMEALSPSDELFGPCRALDVVRTTHDRPAKQIVDALCDAVVDWFDQHKLADDVTVVILKAL